LGNFLLGTYKFSRSVLGAAVIVRRGRTVLACILVV
jgi:hypothetical protein